MQRTIKRGNVDDLTRELFEIEESLVLYFKSTPWVREVDGIVRDSKSRAKGTVLVASSARLYGPTKSPQFFPFAPSRPPAQTARDGLKHSGIKHSSIYKARETGKAVARAAYIEAHGHGQTNPHASEASLRAARYIEGVNSPDKERVVRVCSNVGETYQDRMAFWAKFEAQATFRGDHVVSIDIRGHEKEWAELVAKGVQMDVADAYEMARTGTGVAAQVVNDANAAKRFSKAAKHRALFGKTLNINCPANEIVMSSVIALLPHELSAAGKNRAFERYCDLFARRGLPFQAVIHEPVEGKNDSRNWHVHINYLPYAVKKCAESGKWSFERESYYDSRSRKTRTRKAAGYKRHEDTLAAKDGGWVMMLKAEMCDIANQELVAEGYEARFTLASNSERGLGKAEKPRGPKADALRKKGVRSLSSLESDHAAWSDRAREAALIKGVVTVGKVYRELGLSPRGTEPKIQDQVDEIANLAKLAELARWREDEILSGRQVVQRHQEDVVADKRAAQKKRAEAEAVLQACRYGLEAEAQLLARLRTFREGTAELISLLTNALAVEVGRTGSTVERGTPLEPMGDAKVAAQPAAMTNQSSAEIFRAARDRTKALWLRRQPRGSAPSAHPTSQISNDVKPSIPTTRQQTAQPGIDR